MIFFLGLVLSPLLAIAIKGLISKPIKWSLPTRGGPKSASEETATQTEDAEAAEVATRSDVGVLTENLIPTATAESEEAPTQGLRLIQTPKSHPKPRVADNLAKAFRVVKQVVGAIGQDAPNPDNARVERKEQALKRLEQLRSSINTVEKEIKEVSSLEPANDAEQSMIQDAKRDLEIEEASLIDESVKAMSEESELLLQKKEELLQSAHRDQSMSNSPSEMEPTAPSSNQTVEPRQNILPTDQLQHASTQTQQPIDYGAHLPAFPDDPELTQQPPAQGQTLNSEAEPHTEIPDQQSIDPSPSEESIEQQLKVLDKPASSSTLSESAHQESRVVDYPGEEMEQQAMQGAAPTGSKPPEPIPAVKQTMSLDGTEDTTLFGHEVMDTLADSKASLRDSIPRDLNYSPEATIFSRPSSEYRSIKFTHDHLPISIEEFEHNPLERVIVRSRLLGKLDAEACNQMFLQEGKDRALKLISDLSADAIMIRSRVHKMIILGKSKEAMIVSLLDEGIDDELAHIAVEKAIIDVEHLEFMIGHMRRDGKKTDEITAQLSSEGWSRMLTDPILYGATY